MPATLDETPTAPFDVACRLVSVGEQPHQYERHWMQYVLVVGGVPLVLSGHDREALEIVAASIRRGIARVLQDRRDE